jgi:hypothetical protein
VRVVTGMSTARWFGATAGALGLVATYVGLREAGVSERAVRGGLLMILSVVVMLWSVRKRLDRGRWLRVAAPFAVLVAALSWAICRYSSLPTETIVIVAIIGVFPLSLLLDRS